jgi:DNA-binding GntR family transcriptional regulator
MTSDNRTAAAMPLTRAGAVTERLRQMIKSGELPAGTHLRQAEIAQRFGVSTTPVREAFVALAREGLVIQDAHRGVVVFEPSIDELHDVYEIRIVLESLATEIAAKQISAEEIAALERIVMQMRKAKPARFVELNSEFHGRLYAATNRKRLLEIVDNLRETAANYVGIGVIQYHPEYRKETEREHEEIVAALKARAPKRAAKAMREHLEHSARHVAELIAEFGNLDPTPDRP